MRSIPSCDTEECVLSERCNVNLYEGVKLTLQSLNKAEGKVNDSLLRATYKVKIFLLILSSLTSVCVEADNGQRKETPVLTAHMGEPEDAGWFGSRHD